MILLYKEINNNMSETKQIVKYDYNYLHQFCKENGIKLFKDYSTEKINRDTIIEAKCLMENCNEFCIKNFRAIVNFGSYCKKCKKNISNKKREITCVSKYGVPYLTQSIDMVNKIKKTNLEKYGDTCALRNTTIKEKAKQTCLDKYGVENPFQNEDIKIKIKKTNLNKYGDTCALRNTTIKEKAIQTCLDKYGVENPSQNEDIKQIKKDTCFKNFGVEHSFQSNHIRNKAKITNLIKFGVENISSCPEIRRKAENTMLNKFGVFHAAQSPDLLEKAFKSGCKLKDYILPSGKIIKYQGYENFALDELINSENITEENILNGLSNVPKIWYNGLDNKKHRYYVDLFIPYQKRCIEVKSTYTITRDNDTIKLKQQATKDAGYACEIWVYNSKGEKVECYK
jgi:hypothetical protein